MEFLKKYWLIILLVVVAIVWYFWYMKKQNTIIPPKTPAKTCTDTTVSDWTTRVDGYIAAIEADPDWLDYVTNNIQAGETLAQAKKRNAEFMVTDTDKKCKPAGAA